MLLHRGVADAPADASCVLARRRHFSALNTLVAAILKLIWRQTENPMSVDAYLLEEQSCHISPRSHPPPSLSSQLTV